MATYVLLTNFTDQGIRGVKDTTRRAEAFQATAKKLGANVKDILWTLGQYDIVSIVEAPDEATITALALQVAALGNVRTQTLPAFSAGQMGAILSKIA